MGTMGIQTKPDDFSYTILLKAYARSKSSVGRTMRLLELAKLSKHSFTIRTYNSALHALATTATVEGANAARGVVCGNTKEQTET
jgi:hypothetical protein